MSRVRRFLVPILSVGLITSLAAWWQAHRELRTTTAANEILRETLGDMTIAIGAKDREIDRLVHSPCEAEGKAWPRSPIRSDRRKVSKSNAASELKIADPKALGVHQSKSLTNHLLSFGAVQSNACGGIRANLTELDHE